jgi:hypothetical protein
MVKLHKRIRGVKLPEGVVYVGRPSKWGNPFKVGDDGTRNHAEAVVNYKTYLFMTVKGNKLLLNIGKLKGKDLACWCGEWEPGQPEIDCHGVVLMKLANKEEN